MNLREAQLAARTRLAHTENPARDAELLLLHILGITKAQLLIDPTREITSAELAAYQALLARRAAHEPVQYITGTQEFYGLPFRVTPATLIPRPETELLVESVLAQIPQHYAVRIADVGTGTGCIAIALAVHLPHAHVTALDLSDAALSVARDNASINHVKKRVLPLHSDLLSSVAGQIFDVIVSNPPYVPLGDRSTLAPQVRDFEPDTALYAGEDGLEIYRRLIPQAYAALHPGGLLALEIGYGQDAALRSLLIEWNEVTILNDLQGIPRTILAKRRQGVSSSFQLI
jgi:release factor glutamine methyltransferase